ncbi:hypothetical protein FD29_GL001033 [Companilactobacillus mindensis DSM 14500]|jgi:hypothetical protein|uniref:Uncharacterized protein n=1 Tax=Companilactobacillus mindensis DSM 14500 TaxID=1423770 RepID=A0A0R1QKU5_9LACO|nr:hypothetical protein [Companilactobacillus mindensis]KRL43348.1 hypothetical protein FD29_GL001033 [Companilactobacillus mindensis DSM 14500]GEO79825.1 hypothetical protein LMI01_21560 [Companilactobacillus mindensis]
MDDVDQQLNAVSQKIDKFNDDTKLNLKLHVEHEMEEHKRILPKGLFYGEVHEQIEQAVDEKMAYFTKSQNIDLRPKQLYAYLISELADHPDLSKKELKILAFKYLEQDAKSKFLRKIFKKLWRRMK